MDKEYQDLQVTGDAFYRVYSLASKTADNYTGTIARLETFKEIDSV